MGHGGLCPCSGDEEEVDRGFKRHALGDPDKGAVPDEGGVEGHEAVLSEISVPGQVWLDQVGLLDEGRGQAHDPGPWGQFRHR